MKKFKVNLFIDSATRKMYDLKAMDSMGRSGVPVGIASELVKGDTAIWTIVFNDMFMDGQTAFYAKFMNQMLPDFELTDINGYTIKSSDLKHRILAIDFWSITCPPCIAEMPTLNKLADSLKNKVTFLAFAPLDTKEELQHFLLKHKFNYKIIPNSSDFAKSLGLNSYPTNFVVDRQGRIVSILEGIDLDSTTRRPVFENVEKELRAVIAKEGAK